MSSRIRGAVAALLALSVIGATRPTLRSTADQLKLAGESKLWFDGKSTVRDWSCKATAIEAAIDASGATAVADVLKGQKAVTTATLTFPTEKLDCANGTMNGHMLKALNATKHPNITFALSSYELTAATPTKGTLQGTLTINGVAKAITLPAEFAAGTAGALRVTGSYALKMTEWQVAPPKLMLGTLKVNEMITVNYDLQLQP